MSVGTVSGVNPDDAWQLVSSQTASGASITFSSLSGIYKELMVTYRTVITSANCNLIVRFNGDSTNYNYGATAVWQAAYADVAISYIPLTAYNSYTDHGAGWMKVKNTNLAIPHTVEGGGYVADNIAGLYNPPTAAVISSVLVKPHNTANFSSGTIELWGIPA